MSLSQNKSFFSVKDDKSPQQSHQVLSTYTRTKLKLPNVNEINQTDRLRFQRIQDSRSANDIVYFDLLRHLQNKKSPKIILKHIMQTKKQENFQDLLKQSEEQRRVTQRFIEAKMEQKTVGGQTQTSSQRIQKMQNHELKKIGIYTLKNLSKDQFQSPSNSITSTYSRKYVEDQSKLKNVLCSYIDQNKKYFNKEIIRVESYEKSAPFKVEALNFVEKILPQCQLVQKTLGYNEDNLKRNKLILEKIILERMLLNERNEYNDLS